MDTVLFFNAKGAKFLFKMFENIFRSQRRVTQQRKTSS